MQVYVLNINNQPLMPCSPRTARLLLKSKKAILINQCPFTIKRIDNGFCYKQNIHLGVDAGSKVIGLSATTNTKELYSGEVALRNDITKLIATRRENRRTRRNRLRYRAPRFNNRVSTKKPGWLAPSIQNKINTHIKIIENLHKILPITKIIVEVASFDIQKIKNPSIMGTEYQKGEQLDFFNVREYVLYRDGHTCQCCKGKTKDKILNVHHIESRKTGGNAPNNLITLCEICHTGYHKGLIKLPKTIHRGMRFKDATFMGIMRWSLYNNLKERYSNVDLTYGYITKNTRIANKLPKSHHIDALCITSNVNVNKLNYYYYQKKLRCHNRQIHKANYIKGHKRKLNQAPYIVCGFRLFDKVLYNNQECFISGRRSSGYFKLIKIDGTTIHNSAKAKELKLIERVSSIIIERMVKETVSSSY